MMKQKDWERFICKVNKTDTCWLWTSRIIPRGYGHFTIGGKQRQAHRLCYEQIKGAIPQGLTLDHLCRVRHCVNPEHLEAVTLKENILRGISPSAIHAKKTHCKEGHPYDAISKRGTRFCRRCRHDYMTTWKSVH